ncbi:hypothetical protein, partial [Escherichia coli]|uniref:hypothetical protein n=1 Tax=Escherichia coli TaxID=562 RepID=UPI003D7FE0EC
WGKLRVLNYSGDNQIIPDNVSWGLPGWIFRYKRKKHRVLPTYRLLIMGLQLLTAAQTSHY